VVILDDEFLEAWTHGIIVDCCDSVNGGFSLESLHIQRTTLKSKFIIVALSLSTIEYLHVKNSYRQNPESWALPLPTLSPSVGASTSPWDARRYDAAHHHDSIQ
jgi:hypothetical protein